MDRWSFSFFSFHASRLSLSQILPSPHVCCEIVLQNFLTLLFSWIDKVKAPEANVILLTAIAKAKPLFSDQQVTKTGIDWSIAENPRQPGQCGEQCERRVRCVNFCYLQSDQESYWHGSSFIQVTGDFLLCYHKTLLYLACVDLAKDMSPEERLGRAHDLSLLALLADTIHHFGETVRPLSVLALRILS